ncbi:MAG: hypothetical protein WA324_15500 [Bryobacteraceae bacterium]
MNRIARRIELRKQRWNRALVLTIVTGLAAMPTWAQDVVANASNGMNTAAVGTWAPKLSAIAIVLGAVGVGLVGGHAMKATIAGVTLATLIAINANTVVTWIQSIS